MTVATDERADVELVAAIAASRDDSAFTELLRRYERDAFSLAVHITARHDLAEETVQEAMLRIWTSARTFRSEGSVKAWLMRIVARESIRIIKSAKRKSVKMESEAINKNEESGLSPLIDAESSELAMALRKEFNKLPSLERQLVGLHFGGALTQQEISEALSMPQQTVSYKLTETLKMLRANLSAAGYAAAIPILAANKFGDVLCSGVKVPTGLHEKIISGLSNRPSMRMRRSVRGSAAAKSSVSGFVTAASVFVVSGGILYALATRQPAPAPAVQPTPVVMPAAPAPAAPATPATEPDEIDMKAEMKPLPDWHHRWSFEKGPPRDLLLAYGKWAWNRETKSMDVPDEARIFPIYSLPSEPLLFESRNKGLDLKTDFIMGIEFMQDKARLQFAHMWKKHHSLPTPNIIHRFYIYKNRVVASMNDEPGMVLEYDTPLGNAAMIIQLRNISVIEFIATPLKESELPDFVKDPSTVIKNLEEVKK